MTEPSHAVFLSYASQDAGAATRIATALRGAGIEVWFDQTELRGGEVWDQAIRRQIKTCALFIPIISRATHERDEGYFRLEWKLAVDRSHLISANRAFLLPVVIDDTRDDDDQIPDRFRDVQWTRLPSGETPPSFVERVKRLLSPNSAPVAERPANEPGAPASSAPYVCRRMGVLYATIVAAVLLATVGYFGLERLNRSKPSGPDAASIAVLPLVNESGDASQQYFSDGISEDLITALGQFSGLKVIGRSSAFQFRDSKEDSRSIGSKLGVAHLIEGSVRKSGDMIRVSAELIDTTDGSMQWSEHYDRPYKDLFALQDEITHAVAVALRTRLLTTGEQPAQQSERPPGGSLEAYNAMLQGRFYHRGGSDADVRKAIEYLTRATQLDPRYAYAWSELSICWTNLSGVLGGAPAQEAVAKAREAADRALALAPDLGYAHAARGWLIENADFDWRGAEAEFRRAVVLAPNDDTVKANFSLMLSSLGELEQALTLIQQVIATDPLR
ncbi:MAG TPA: TIR domain-containing protein, partial [Steroidobacteraceae bacterium]|nr:TIR domain-containing protein [Steroidobacteraceae bacterium]